MIVLVCLVNGNSHGISYKWCCLVDKDEQDQVGKQGEIACYYKLYLYPAGSSEIRCDIYGDCSQSMISS